MKRAKTPLSRAQILSDLVQIYLVRLGEAMQGRDWPGVVYWARKIQSVRAEQDAAQRGL